MDHANGANGHPTSPRHLFVFDNMRTRSHLFWRWISTHPDLYTTYHRYLKAGFLGPQNVLPKLRDTPARTKENQEMLKFVGEPDTFDSSNRQLETDIAEAEKQGKVLFTNEHIIDLTLHYIQLDVVRRNDAALPSFDFEFPNPTYMDDKLIERFTPIILIRHPVLQIQSVYSSMTKFTQCRPGGENFHLITSLHFSRLMFEFFRLRLGKVPIVVDGEDILWRTNELGANFCHAVGIAPDGLSDSWEQLGKEWWSENPFLFAMTETIYKSTGIDRPDVKPDAPSVDVAVKRWTEECGPEVAQQLEERVRLAMPHYEHLVRFKI